MKYIIIQAGGKGKRLGYLTHNKPKALVSINGLPIIFHLMSLYQHATFIIIGDYKRDVFKKYLKSFCKYKYIFTQTNNLGTCAGIKKATTYIPNGSPFMIAWCDLYFSKNFLPKKLKTSKTNYIGLSNSFTCRWAFEKNTPVEKLTNKKGIAGIYTFKNTSELKNIPLNGEFCQYLKEDNIKLSPFILKNSMELGNLPAFEESSKNFPNTRPFNKIFFYKKTIVKKPVDSQGRFLAKYESNWYKTTKKLKLTFVPKIFSVKPLKIERVKGDPLFKYQTNQKEKGEILLSIINNLKIMHSSLKPIQGNFYLNNNKAIIEKTKVRLDQIANLIPDIKQDIIIVNGLKCINFYKKWGLLQKLVDKYYTNEYKLIHGDPTFSNTLIENTSKKIYFLDPRGYFGDIMIYGDPDYDWSKLYYSIVGNYDRFNSKDFRLTMDKNNNILDIPSSGWEFLENKFFEETGTSREKIKIFHAILWLSLTTYAWDNYDSICGAFYKGISLMQEIYEEIHKKRN